MNVVPCVLDGRVCAVTLDCDGLVRVRDVLTGKDVREPTGPGCHGLSAPGEQGWLLRAVTLDSVPHAVLPVSGGVEYWDLDTGCRRWRLEGSSRSDAGPLVEDLEVFRTSGGEFRLGVATEDELWLVDSATGLLLLPPLTVPMDSTWQVWALPDARSTDLVAVTSGWGEVALWDLTGSRLGDVHEGGVDPVTVQGYRDHEGRLRLALVHQQNPEVVMSWQPETNRTETLLESTSPFLFADDPRLVGAVAVTARNDSVLEGHRLRDGEVILRADHPATGDVRWLVVLPGSGGSVWACCFANELRFLDTTTGRWSDPITTFHPTLKWHVRDIGTVHAAPEGQLLLGFTDGWAVVKPDRTPPGED
ncbi:MAG: hypothetical protein Q4D96_09725 [Propionibacteriaceae bacterium]|nr:hypothetical protein [Propionibacteriaceae bacterium]